MTTVTVPSPLPGTSYRRPAPDKEPFKTEATTWRLATRSA